jgi:hypothetical protein
MTFHKNWSFTATCMPREGIIAVEIYARSNSRVAVT